MMMEDTNIEGEKMEQVMLPGFRFHPTDEELVGFYLKRKIQQRPLSIELIKQLDIYKYDPWDLPKVASTGEKEWYFYCPRDRKYRNSVRPNRVTVAGFWKATGTDRPIYSSKENKCIGLKKSLVFYKGRAAKGVKTEWMMHEFRLPSLIDSSSPNTFMDKNMPANDSWAICRIFKKPTHSAAQRSHHHRSCSSPSLPPPTTEPNCRTSTTLQQPFFTNNIDMHELGTCPIETLYSRTLDNTEASPYSSFHGSDDLLNQFFPLPPLEATSELFSTPDVSAILQSMSCSNTLEDLGWLRGGGVGSYGAPQGYAIANSQEESGFTTTNNTYSSPEEETMRSVGLGMNGSDGWRWSSLGWDSPTCPGELSTLFSTTKCYN